MSRFSEKWISIILLVVCASCSREPAHAPFYRFVEDVVPGDKWHETEVRIANETRNVLFAPYRSDPSEVEVAADGTIPLGAVADIEKVSPGAIGVRIGVEQLADKGDDAETEEVTRHIYVSLPAERDLDALAVKNVRVLSAEEKMRKVAAWAREVMPLPQEYVTKPVRIPSSARLDFGIALEHEGVDTSVRFNVSTEHGGTRATIFTQTLAPLSTGFETGWVDASVDLSETAGSKVCFVFRTEIVRDGEKEGEHEMPSYVSPVWSSPVLYSTEAEREADRPNVLLISLDTLRADHLGCYGYNRETSPNIDTFAEEALLFEYAIAPAPWTLPSHASLFTGLHPSVHKAGTLSVSGSWERPIQKAETTLAELARKHGYLTAAYTEGVYVSARLGFAQGFELYSDGDYEARATSFKLKMQTLDKFGSAEETFNRALEWLRRHSGQPFLLFVHTYQLHVPYSPPGRFATMFDPHYTGPLGKIRYPSEAKSDADMVHIEALYDGEIAYTDQMLGNFLSDLEEMGLLDNTVVIIFSDHGEEFWEHGGAGHRSTLYDEQLRVPLIIRLAGEDRPIRRVERQVSLTDLYATVADILGVDCDRPPDCMSLLSVIGGSELSGHYDRQFVVSELVYRSGFSSGRRPVTRRKYSIRTEREKYIRYEEEQKEEVYDLRADPGEKRDIAAQNQPRLGHYRQLLSSFMEAVAIGRTPSDVDEPQPAPLSEQERRQLKALGYL